jgi:Ca2+-binding RTX toxin-like protein
MTVPPQISLKPVLSNPLVVTLKASGNPDIINANGRDVELRWPSVPVTDTTIEIRNARHIHSIGGHFKPTGADNDSHRALEIRDQVTGGVAYLERMLIDVSARSHQQAYVHSDPDAIDKIPVTGDAIGFGGVVSATAPTYPSFVMVQSIVKGVSGQHPNGCTTCTGSHADAFQLRGPIDNVTFKDVHVSSTYQGIFGAPANNFYGEIVPPEKQQKAGGVITLDNVTATVVKPEGLTSQEAVGWRSRATGYYLESYSLRVEGEQSYFNIDVGPGGMYLETPSDEGNWLQFIGGKTVLHTAIDANSASISYAPGAVLTKGKSPNIPDESMVGPGSTLEGNGDDVALGGEGNDELDGGAGNDTLYGLAGNDTLDGQDGNDTLLGGLGADALIGGVGFDYASYAGSTAGLTARLDMPGLNTGEAAGDTYTTIEGLIGSGFNDLLVGNGSANVLLGGAGNDTLYGVAGNDTLDGQDGNDTLVGGEGNDTLVGGEGNDTFFFNASLNAITNVDRVTDFSAPADTMRLENAVFTALTATGTLAAGAFHIGAAAHDASDRVIYNPSTGALTYDSNGNAAGGAVQFATLGTGLALTNADFVVV